MGPIGPASGRTGSDAVSILTLFAILTLFPEAVEAYASEGILRVAQEKGKIGIECIDFRDFTRDRHRSVDDRPFGGGPGMLLRPEPIAEAVAWLEARHGAFRRIALCPAGQPFHQRRAEEYADEERILLLCGRYEGFDARLLDELAFEELSIGDYVLAGGELAALAVTEAVARLLPGVLGDERSAAEDSFGASGGELDCPHYTRPRVWRGREVPPVLLSGDHAAIERWRRTTARERTLRNRPDLAGNDAGPARTDVSISRPADAGSPRPAHSGSPRPAHSGSPRPAHSGSPRPAHPTPNTRDPHGTRGSH